MVELSPNIPGISTKVNGFSRTKTKAATFLSNAFQIVKYFSKYFQNNSFNQYTELNLKRDPMIRK